MFSMKTPVRTLSRAGGGRHVILYAGKTLMSLQKKSSSQVYYFTDDTVVDLKLSYFTIVLTHNKISFYSVSQTGYFINLFQTINKITQLLNSFSVSLNLKT